MNPFNFIQRDLFLQAIVELGGAGGLVPRDPGRDLEVAAVSEVLGDPGAAEAVGADLGGESRLSGAALDHLERTQARHRPVLEGIAPPGLAAPEEGPAAVFADAGGLEVGVDVFLGRMVGGDDVVPPALLVEPEERARTLGVVVGDPERDGGARSREAVDEDAEERAVTKACERRGRRCRRGAPGSPWRRAPGSCRS